MLYVIRFGFVALWPTESDNLETILEKHETAEGVESVTDMPADDSDNYVSFHPPPLEKPNTSSESILQYIIIACTYNILTDFILKYSFGHKCWEF